MLSDTTASHPRVLVLAPVGRDAELLCGTLRQNGAQDRPCRDLDDLCGQISPEIAAAVIAQEALGDTAPQLERKLREQPPWSDLPLILLTRRSGGMRSEDHSLSSLISLGNTTLVERPFHPLILISLIRSAARARLRQYEIRNRLEERERLLRSEKAARETAERYNRMKDEFLATVSHELRTPLNAILGWAAMLQETEHGNPDTRHGLQVIANNGKAQLRLIEELLDISRITSGNIRLNISAVDLRAVIRETVDIVRPAAASKNIGIELDLENGPPSVAGDQDRLRQVVWNLLSNAVKFTPQGGRLSVGLRSEESGVRIEVTDTGEGISPDFLPYVFARFTQGDSTTTRRYSGLGLGLALVRQFVELHGGTVSAASEGLGRGSTFVIKLPVAEKTQPQVQLH